MPTQNDNWKEEQCDHNCPTVLCNRDTCDGVPFVHTKHCGRCGKAVQRTKQQEINDFNGTWDNESYVAEKPISIPTTGDTCTFEVKAFIIINKRTGKHENANNAPKIYASKVVIPIKHQKEIVCVPCVITYQI